MAYDSKQLLDNIRLLLKEIKLLPPGPGLKMAIVRQMQFILSHYLKDVPMQSYVFDVLKEVLIPQN